MWFNPNNLLISGLTPSANSANLLICDYELAGGAIDKIIDSGFEISKLAELAEGAIDKIIDSGFEISKLAELAEPNTQAFIICYSPSGQVFEVEASSPEHAEFLKRMNPPPMNKELTA